MSAEPRAVVALLLATHLAAGAVGWHLAPREILDSEVKHTGPFQTDQTKVLRAAVESLREENRLEVLSVTGNVAVQTDRSIVVWPFRGSQVLVVPTNYTYSIDLSDLTLADVRYDERAKLVTVRLPKLVMGEVAFQSERALVVNSGLITWSDAQVQELMRANYLGARRAAVKQAQDAGLIAVARRRAQADVASAFEIPLRIAGLPDVKVAATFG